MSHRPALATDATTTRRTHAAGASRRTGLMMLLTGIVGWLASFQLTVDDRRLHRSVLVRDAALPGAGIVPVPWGVLEVVRDTHWLLLAAWYGVITLLVLTRFWPYWSSPL
ncbi:hypothetical protein OHA79_40200 [Streptomyces sp. NBC_00841]|uniref:hypothetical protein n=1 Tax=unclassified Streptomyces TaxID=2593676 RepID=UPI002256478E|nr:MULTISPECIES: hypothetical protein [unclassified Streptomyces]MCX4530765.1 hypothetical protein [Streptomyces sp. NBC_01669]WSA03489.1 hypothetical protein OHA79_40200 [Streptomyces sp. NBC_00841]